MTCILSLLRLMSDSVIFMAPLTRNKNSDLWRLRKNHGCASWLTWATAWAGGQADVSLSIHHSFVFSCFPVHLNIFQQLPYTWQPGTTGVERWKDRCGVSGAREDVQPVLRLLRVSDSWKCEAYKLVSSFDTSDITKSMRTRAFNCPLPSPILTQGLAATRERTLILYRKLLNKIKDKFTFDIRLRPLYSSPFASL